MFKMKQILTLVIISSLLAGCGSEPETVQKEVVLEDQSFPLPSCDVMCEIKVPGIPVIVVPVPQDQVEEFETANQYATCGESICKDSNE